MAVAILGDSTKSAGLFGFVKDIANNPKFFGGYFAGLTGAKTGGNVSELSVQYNDYLDKYVVLWYGQRGAADRGHPRRPVVGPGDDRDLAPVPWAVRTDDSPVSK